MKTVRDLRHLRPLGVLMVGLRRKYTGREFRTSGLGSEKKKSTLKIGEKNQTLSRLIEGEKAILDRKKTHSAMQNVFYLAH